LEIKDLVQELVPASAIDSCLQSSLLRKQRAGGLQFKASLDKQFERHYLEKNPSQKRAGGVAQGVGPEFKIPVP
jgi:hypothetical protein